MPAPAHKVALTDRSLKALKPAAPGRRDTIWDSLMPGLAVRVSPFGRVSFYVVKRQAGRQQPSWVCLGHYPPMTLAEARNAARDALLALMDGRHPVSLAAQRRRALEAADEQRFEHVAERFIAEYAARLRSAKVYAARVRRDLIPAFGQTPITEIKRRDVIKLLEDVAARSGPGSAVSMLAILRKLMSWAVARDLVEHNVAAGVKPGELIGRAKARDRLLSDAELAIIWRAIPAVGEPWGTVYRLLLLTGARLREIADAKWEDFDEAAATLTIPAARAKNGEAMLIPLSPTAVALIAAVPQFSGPHIFTTSGGRLALHSWSRARAKLDAALGSDIPAFVIHDFRRCVRSGLGRLGVSAVVAELVLGHRQPGIVGVYDRHSYLDEKRDALLRWEARLLGIVAPEPEPAALDNVVALPARARG